MFNAKRTINNVQVVPRLRLHLADERNCRYDGNKNARGKCKTHSQDARESKVEYLLLFVLLKINVQCQTNN